MARCEEGDVVRELEENAACVVAGELEDAGEGLDQALHRADHQRAVEGFLGGQLGEDLEVHLPGYLREIQTHNSAINFELKIFGPDSQRNTIQETISNLRKIFNTDPWEPSGC